MGHLARMRTFFTGRNLTNYTEICLFNSVVFLFISRTLRMQPTGKTKCTAALGQLQNSRSRFELILLIGFSFKYRLTELCIDPNQEKTALW